MRYGLLGERLGHSFSPQIHHELWGADYGLFPMGRLEAQAFLDARDFDGLNVTIPYKTLALECCDEVEPLARRIGSVNTVVNREGKLFGYNTDYHGLRGCMQRGGLSLAGKKVLIFGGGGTSKTARVVAEDCGAREIVVISRRGEDNYTNLSRHDDGEILINTTPVGLFPDTDAKIVDPALFPRCSGVADVVYNPLNTRFLCRARELGLPAVGGLSMLVIQAQVAAKHFVGIDISEAKAEACLAGLERRCQNLVLIGMPGCGKSTVGQRLSVLLDMPLVDTDAEIEHAAGKTIPRIMAEEGETTFRDLETEVLRRFGSGHGQIIATGGGAVLRTCNRFYLRQNGYFCYLYRPLEQLATEGRPLSKGGRALESLYTQRHEIYTDLCDASVSNTDTPERVARQIMEGWLE